jgi:flagellar M-ring protein FliF
MNEQAQALLKQLSITQRIGIIGAALLSVAMIAVLVMFASKPEYTAAFTNLSAADAGTVEGALRGANIPYLVEDAGGTITVPVEKLGDAKIAAAAAGISAGSSDVSGWSLFDNQGFGTSQFDQTVTYQRALEGELTKTIQAMSGISTARVAIVLAQKGAVSSQDTPASASVVLSMTGGSVPSSGLVAAVVNTVAHSVEGLAADNVVVTDDQGHVLAGAANSADTAAAQAKDLIEQQTKTKIQTLVDAALGTGHAAIAVSADVDTSKVVSDVTTYAPSGSNPPVSINNTIEQYGAGSSTAACGIPGSNSNVPGLSSYPGVCAAATAAPSAAASAAATATPNPSATAAAAVAGATSASGYLKQETTINYSVSSTVQHIVTEPGVVKRLSVSVLVDQAVLGSMNADTLKTSIAAAIGADLARGDVVSVQAVSFAAASAAPVAASSAPDVVSTVGGMSGTIIGVVLALVMLLLFWMNMGALRRRTEETISDLGPAGAAAALGHGSDRVGIPATTGEAEAAADVSAKTPQAMIQERLRIVADERPEALASLMHEWLREEDKRR